MDLVWSFLLISGLSDVIVLYWASIGHVNMFCTGWILDKAPHTKETLSDFFLNYESW